METLPAPRDLETRRDYEALGFVFGETFADDKLFCQVTMPAGWSKGRTGHGMHNDILDPLGNRRGSFFYKAAFWDRDAILYRPVRRYNVEEYADDVRDVYERNSTVRYCVVDRVLAVAIEARLNTALEEEYRAKPDATVARSRATVAEIRAELVAATLFTSEFTVDAQRPSEGRSESDEEMAIHRAWWDRHDELRKLAIGECNTWLATHRPDHMSPAAYWPT